MNKPYTLSIASPEASLTVKKDGVLRMKSKLKRKAVAGSIAALLAVGLTPSALAADAGTNSLAAVLTAKSSFDSDQSNYDIVTAAVLAVLKAKPDSAVKVLADGTVALTAFIPNDGAFQKLVSQLTNKAPVSEQATFDAVAGLGIDTVEQVLLYHVIPGATIASADALKSDGATLTTASSGKSISVSVAGTTITLKDKDAIAADPVVILSQVDINKGNKQIAHGIDSVLLPVQLLKPLGNASLASILTAKSSFDKDNSNYDILTAAVLAVLKAKPDSSVKVLTDGKVALTAFIPNDGAFKSLVRALTKKPVTSEQSAFNTVAGLGIGTVEQILLYHVVPGATIVSEAALKANGAVLKTALAGKTIKVTARGSLIQLADYNKLQNPKVILKQTDINRGNVQVAHGIDFVLLPNK